MSTAVILAGGKSRRMQQDKLDLRIGSESLLESAVKKFAEHFDTVFVSVADQSKYSDINAMRIVDTHPGCGPIAGLYTGLLNTQDDGIFLVAADLPFADPLAAKRIIELAGNSDICIMTDGAARFEPLFGFYRKTLLPYVAQALGNGNYKIAALFDKVKLRVAAKAELGSLWNEKLLMNINYPEDYERLFWGI